jgi:polyhydroxyalkanoate synthase
MQRSVEAAPVDDKTKAQLRFATRQFVDAMSPANYLATNPEAIELALSTGGASLTEGLALFFKDLAKGHVSITDEEVFEVGKNVAVTEGTVVYRNEVIELIQYAPRTPEVGSRPLVIIPPCINKYYILDLTPENSFVRYAVDEGNTVFMASWRNISAAQGHLTWDDYLRMGVMRAIDVARDITGADRVNALGFCIGGTLLAAALAVMKANGDDKVASVTLLTSMLDFADAGEIGALVTPESVAAREASIGRGGVMEGKDLALTFSALRANDLIWPYVVNSYLKGKRPPAFDLLYWNSDSTNLPGPMFCWYVRNTYLENLLRVPGRTIQCGAPVNLGRIDLPAFIYASREDHIVPWGTAYLSRELLGGDNTFILGASGHIAGVINPPAKGKRNYWCDGDASRDAEHWFSTATSVPGSWWPVWGDWLAQVCGDPVPAPSRPGNATYPSLAAAPGAYVLAKA